jgi:hypothetical protein
MIRSAIVLFVAAHAAVAPARDPSISIPQEAVGQTESLPQLLDWAKKAEDHVRESIHDYSAVLVKRERIDNKLAPRQVMFVKIRQDPFSVYLHFLEPSNILGQEAIYVAGRNGGNIEGHAAGWAGKLLGTIELPPDSYLAMRGQRYPITDIGLENLCRKLIEFGEHAPAAGEVEIRRFSHAAINGRSCTCLRIAYPVREPNVAAYLIRIFVDDQLDVPIRLEAYEVSSTGDSRPRLVEEYTYLDLKLNQGFTDADFSRKNPRYGYN